MKIGICGGTFDPFHRGHLDPILSVRRELEWDRVIYVPAHRQPFKIGSDSASGYHRFAMAVLATEASDAICVSPWELERSTISYTVDTLEHLCTVYPDAALDWIIGDDNLGRLDDWKSLDRIFELANFVVLSRGGAEVPAKHALRVSGAASRPKNGAIVVAPNVTIPISSTEVRARVRAGEPIDALVDPRVSRYIHHNGLYKGTM